MLVEAFGIVCKQRDDVLLYILGDTSNQEEYDKVTSIAQDLGILDKVNCVGFQNNPYPYIKYADCFALSSRWEGLPNVLIESLYLGTPAAAMKCIPIIERIITDGVDGYTAGKEDVGGLAEAIRKTLELGRITSSYKGSTKNDFIKKVSTCKNQKTTLVYNTFMSFKSISKFLENYPLHRFKNLLFLSLANLPMPGHTFRPILVR